MTTPGRVLDMRFESGLSHLQSQPDTLVSRIFKARYYRTGEFLTAELGHNPSFVWRSVLEAREVVRMGARRRVGNGEEINIINDPWLPCEDNPRVTTAHPSLVDKNVSTLFETGILAWDKDLVHDLFNRRDAELILSITLSQSRNKDRWILFYFKNTFLEQFCTFTSIGLLVSSRVQATTTLTRLAYKEPRSIEVSLLRDLSALVKASESSFLIERLAMVLVCLCRRCDLSTDEKNITKGRKFLEWLHQNVLCSEIEKIRLQGCQIISDIAARRETLIEVMVEAGLIDPLSALRWKGISPM
ncbi:hypothetical protein POM88_009904 [Heracleum sosnowskyi]|uniref:Uncharacterized protein n=1 Tax=Heracleum sosnowskyi TaxID=360622 RepID=A0AAD8JA86_9APIA|nr:hypothetical protein POM88_009904 [Heracleum sosnowskyi]